MAPRRIALVVWLAVLAFSTTALACSSGMKNTNWNGVLLAAVSPVIVLTPLKVLWLRRVIATSASALGAWLLLLLAKPAGVIAYELTTFSGPDRVGTAWIGYLAGHAIVTTMILDSLGSRRPIVHGIAMSIAFPLLHLALAVSILRVGGL